MPKILPSNQVTRATRSGCFFLGALGRLIVCHETIYKLVLMVNSLESRLSKENNKGTDIDTNLMLEFNPNVAMDTGTTKVLVL
jgi:hypothetical protein